jgi:peptidoglycan/LPS O-acetylase OafA/YrhL
MRCDAMRSVAALAVFIQHFADYWIDVEGYAHVPLLRHLLLDGLSGQWGFDHDK